MRQSKSIPFLPFRPLRRLHIHRCLLDLIPICTQRRAPTLRVAFHHRLLRVLICIGKDLLEERVEGAVPAHVGVFFGCLFLFGGEDVGGDTVPVLFGLAYGGCLVRGGWGDVGRVGEGWLGVGVRVSGGGGGKEEEDIRSGASPMRLPHRPCARFMRRTSIFTLPTV